MNRRNLFKVFGSLVAMFSVRTPGSNASTVASNLPSQTAPVDTDYIDIHMDTFRTRVLELTYEVEEWHGYSPNTYSYYQMGVKLMRRLSKEAVTQKKNLRLILSERDMRNNRPMVPYHMIVRAHTVEIHYSDGSKKVLKNLFNNYGSWEIPTQSSSMSYDSKTHFKL